MRNRLITVLVIVFSYVMILFLLSSGSSSMYQYDDESWQKSTLPMDSLRIKLGLLEKEFENFNAVATMTTTDLESVSDAYQIISERLGEIDALLTEKN